VKIGIIGATGKAGRPLCAEAITRGPEVTAIVRNSDRAGRLLGPDVPVLTRDAFDLTGDDLSGFDVIIDAFSTAPAYVSAAKHGPGQARGAGLSSLVRVTLRATSRVLWRIRSA
jgi:putative NADH-flavin reductase